MISWLYAATDRIVTATERMLIQVAAVPPSAGGAYTHDSANTFVWYLSPRQHAIELLLFNLIALPVIWALARQPAPVWLAKRTPKAGSWFRRADMALGIVAVTTWLSTFLYKVLTERMVYMLQPCHLSNMVLIWLVFIGPTASRRWATLVLGMYLEMWFGSAAALAMPDLRGLDLPLEKVNFMVQHVMLTFAPFYLLARRPVDITLSLRVVTLNFVLFAAVHWNLYGVVNIVAGSNVNYMAQPPMGFGELVGTMYRPIILASCYVVILITRFIIFTPWAWLFGATAAAEAVASVTEATSGQPVKHLEHTPIAYDEEDSVDDVAGSTMNRSASDQGSSDPGEGSKSPRVRRRGHGRAIVEQ